jgi:hypothetical protein
MHRVATTCGARPGWVYVRALRGDDEESVDAVDTAQAIALVDRLLVPVPGAAHGPGDARRMTPADRDRVLATVYVRELGARVRATPACPACEKTFDLDFQLDALLASLAPDRGELRVETDGSFSLPDGTRFRLPCGDDELASISEARPAEALLARCHLGGPTAPDALAAVMERAAPLVEAELATTCPECGHRHAVRFELQAFFLGTLLAERRQRVAEVQQLARAFGWSLTEILSMTRAQRRMHVAMADRDGGLR